MGEMTNEEAIALLQVQMNFNRTMQRGWGNTLIETDAGNIVDGALYANQHKDVADALELAINALRVGGKDMNVPTMPAGQTLTLDLENGTVKVEETGKTYTCERLGDQAMKILEAGGIKPLMRARLGK